MSTPKKPDQVGPEKPLQQTLGGVVPPRPPAPAEAEVPTWDDATDMADASALRLKTNPTPSSVPVAGDRTLEAPVPAAVTRALASQLARDAAAPPKVTLPQGSPPKVATPIEKTAEKTPRPEPRATAPTVARPATGGHREVAVTAQASPPPPAAPAAHGDPYLGTVVADRYRVLSKLGEGGMGVVYLAEHIIIEKKVALKILSEDFARKADLVQRFMQEAKAASKIGHENIVDITDFGETPSGSVFFTMEYLEGSDLAGHIRKGGPIAFPRTRHVVTQICRALGAAHAKGIIHRDMKPENVFLIEREGEADFVKILDFGIAKMNTMEEGARLTRTGMIFGTPEYMSPEQAKGDRPDHRVDIYAVGCILYEMLTGDVPFHADTFMGVLTKHMFEAPMPLNQRAPQANIPADVEAVVMKALAKDRDQRFQTMKEMSVALAACGGYSAEEGWGNEPSQVITRDDASVRLRMSSHMATAGAPGTAQTIAPAAPAPQGRRNLWLGAAVAAVVLVGGGAAAIAMLRPKQVDPVVKQLPMPVTPATPKVAEPVKPSEPAAPPAPTQFTMTFNSHPEGAEIFRGAEQVGVTPSKVVFAASAPGKPVPVVVKKKGYRDYAIDVAADKDRVFEFDLVAVKASHPSRPTALPRPPRPDKPATPPPASPPSSPQKPSGKLRDLKDPFSQGQ